MCIRDRLVYVKIPQETKTEKKDVRLGDAARIYSRDKAAEARVKALRLVSFQKARRKTSWVGSVMEIIQKACLLYTSPHAHNVGIHDRCKTTVEPMIKPQWFVKMEEMAKPAIEALKTGELKFVPESYGKTYLHWLEGIRDWCISRQLWWGHRIPAYYCDDCGEMTVSKEKVEVCPKCGGHHIRQDEDTLDTWFSSALWPFSTLGWPKDTEEYRYFYPTDVLEMCIRDSFQGLQRSSRPCSGG